MSKMTLPEGWTYEGPDESVGIFGEAFYHCVDEEATVETISERVIKSWPANKDQDEDPVREVEFTLRLTCSCGTVVDVTRTDLV